MYEIFGHQFYRVKMTSHFELVVYDLLDFKIVSVSNYS